MIANNNVWTLHEAVAELRHGSIAGRLDVQRPDLGLKQLQLNGRDSPGELLAIRRQAETAPDASAWPLSLADRYVRGGDLVASYRSADDWPFAPQLYWSANSLGDVGDLLGSLSLLISVQTHLLDTWPRITINSQLANDDLLHLQPITGSVQTLKLDQTICPSLADCCVLHRLAELPISYVEIMPASDFRELTVRRNASGGCRAEWHLFADFLEKGVIRRARLHAAFLPRSDDVRLAFECCKAIERRPLPLTT